MKSIQAKIVLLGTQGVGKTSLVTKYVTKTHSDVVAPTIGATFFNCRITIEDIKVKMQVWDTAGTERFRSMAPMYYRNANAALLVFDLTNYITFLEIMTWVSELQRNVQTPMVLTLVGNKCDLLDQRQVSREEAAIYATSIGGYYFETSSMSNEGYHSIEKAFTQTALGLIRLSEDINTQLRRYESKDSLPTISFLDSTTNPMLTSGITLAGDINDEENCRAVTGRVESVAFSIDHIALGNEHRAGCCW